ncbi:MAG: hypothetical protein K0Q81_1762 [Paenibacillus sp.]|jgi:uncharacterized membrane protein YsdA (DUF1294 family)|nr:hypothetical protein [Paenibacillus sp.]
MEFIIVYLLILNFAGFAVMGVDKNLAKQRERRIPERRLFLTALAGGAAGIWIGMRLWRHKTMHNSFTVGIPLLFVLNVVVVIFLLTYPFS